MRAQTRSSAVAFASTRWRNAAASPALALAIQRASSSVMLDRMHAGGIRLARATGLERPVALGLLHWRQQEGTDRPAGQGSVVTILTRRLVEHEIRALLQRLVAIEAEHGNLPA